MGGSLRRSLGMACLNAGYWMLDTREKTAWAKAHPDMERPLSNVIFYFFYFIIFI
jgi:hypothetical protein